MTVFKLTDPIELNIRPGMDLSQFFTYDYGAKRWRCFCGTMLSTHHGNRWRHIHRMHPELIKTGGD